MKIVVADGVRSATVDEILDLRWRVLRAGRPRHTAALPGDDAPTTRHWALWVGGVVVGCVTLMAQDYPDDGSGPGPSQRLRGMAVDGSAQGRGLGSTLLRAVHEAVAAPMWCDARLHAVPFYAAHGWRARTDIYEVEGVGPHRRMSWSGPA